MDTRCTLLILPGWQDKRKSWLPTFPFKKCEKVGGQVFLQGWPHPCCDWVGQGGIPFVQILAKNHNLQKQIPAPFLRDAMCTKQILSHLDFPIWIVSPGDFPKRRAGIIRIIGCPGMSWGIGPGCRFRARH